MIVEVLLFASGPALAMVLGGTIAAFRAPGPRLSSYFQHFAAGVVFAAVSVELLPQVLHQRAPIAAVVGFAAGTALMLGIRSLTSKMGIMPRERKESGAKEAGIPLSLVATIGVDVFIDGLLIGIGFTASAQTGALLTVALGIEVLFLGLSTAAGMSKAGCSRPALIATICGLALLLPTGAALGVGALRGLQGASLEVALSFGCAALLYLVTEELLVEAHEVPETPTATAMFFAGFLVLLVFNMLNRTDPTATQNMQAPRRERPPNAWVAWGTAMRATPK